MKIKVLKRNPEDYVRESKHDIHKINRNYRFIVQSAQMFYSNLPL